MKKPTGLLALWVSAGLLTAAPVDVSVFKGPIRVACIGDSITAGVGTTQDNSYPTQLSRMLGGKWVVMNFGVGSTTLLNHGDKPYQKEAAFQRALEFQPDVVVIKLGPKGIYVRVAKDEQRLSEMNKIAKFQSQQEFSYSWC